MYFSRRFTVAHKLTPLPWVAHGVVPLYDEAGSLLAYVETFDGVDRTDLPVEMFRHVMDKVDPSDPDQMTKFMSKYGIVGSAVYDGSELISRRPEKRQNVLNAILDIKGLLDVAAIERRHHLYGSVNGNPNAWVCPSDETLRWYLAVQDSLKRAGYAVKDSGDLNPGDITYLILVTPQEAQNAFNSLHEAGRTARVIAAPNNQETAAWITVMDPAEIDEAVRLSDGYINSCLMSLTPRIGFVRERDAASPIPPEFPASYEDEGSGQYWNGERGGLEEAIAAQLYNFALEASNCRICPHCLEPFVEKYSPGRKGTARSTAEYCSDGCQKAAKAKRSREKRKRGAIRDMQEAVNKSNKGQRG